MSVMSDGQSLSCPLCDSHGAFPSGLSSLLPRLVAALHGPARCPECLREVEGGLSGLAQHLADHHHPLADDSKQEVEERHRLDNLWEDYNEFVSEGGGGEPSPGQVWIGKSAKA